jgi:hypothetical protein
MALIQLPAAAFVPMHTVRMYSGLSLNAFSRRFGNEYDEYDDDDDSEDEDSEPEFSMSPQEFLSKLKQSQYDNGDEIPSAIPSFTSSRPRSAPRLRPQLGSKQSSAKDTTVYACTNCNSQYLQWRGRCVTCEEWNTIEQFTTKKKSGSMSNGVVEGMRPLKSVSIQRGSSWLDGSGMGVFENVGEGPVRLTDVYSDILPKGAGDTSWKDAYTQGSREKRIEVPDDPEINTVLGGGILPGSIILVGGDPGVFGS